MARELFSDSEKNQIVSAIKDAEINTSGEIRVHIEKKCPKEVLDRAKEVFFHLKMDETELSNGVLFYISTDDHKFAILGDKGIDETTPANFWDDIKEHMLVHLKAGNIANALSEGIEMAGKALKEHFPYQSDDVNELSDEISFGDE